MLLRTAQSLLSTQEPKLTPPATACSQPEDIEFLAQLAREFPQVPPEPKHQRTTSFSLSPKLITPDADTKISTAFNRKLSLQLNETRKYKEFSKLQHRESHLFEPTELLSSTTNNERDVKFKTDTPPSGGSISSVEDESGFSSMNSFQDVGLPLATGEEVSTKNALLRSMLHNNLEQFSSSFEEKSSAIGEEQKLWQVKPEVAHKRWSSTPVHHCPNAEKRRLNVLWV